MKRDDSEFLRRMSLSLLVVGVALALQSSRPAWSGESVPGARRTATSHGAEELRQSQPPQFTTSRGRIKVAPDFGYGAAEPETGEQGDGAVYCIAGCYTAPVLAELQRPAAPVAPFEPEPQRSPAADGSQANTQRRADPIR